MGGREGPRASFRLLQPHDPRPRARREAACARRSIVRSPRSPAAAARRRRAASGSSRPSSRPTRASTSTTTCGASRCRRRATRVGARRVRATRRELPRPVAPAVGVHVDRRARRRAGRARSRRSTTRSATVSAALKLSLALLDLEPDPAPSAAKSPQNPTVTTPARGPLDVLRGAASTPPHAASRRGRARGTRSDQRAHAPDRTSRRARSTRPRLAASVGRRGSSPTARTPTSSRPGRCAGTSRSHRVSLPALKDVADALGGSVNDAYVTGSCAGLGRYHERHGSTVSELRMAMPVSTRGQGDAAANRFAPARVLVPIQPADDPAALFAEIHDRLATTKRSRRSPRSKAWPGSRRSCRRRSSSRSRATRPARSTSRRPTCGAVPCRSISRARASSRTIPFGPRSGTALNVTTFGLRRRARHRHQRRSGGRHRHRRVHARHLTAGFDELLELA